MNWLQRKLHTCTFRGLGIESGYPVKEKWYTSTPLWWYYYCEGCRKFLIQCSYGHEITGTLPDEVTDPERWLKAEYHPKHGPDAANPAAVSVPEMNERIDDLEGACGELMDSIESLRELIGTPSMFPEQFASEVAELTRDDGDL